MPEINLFFLQASRSIRTAWLLEELSLPYNAFKNECGNPLGKAPTLKDGELTVTESGAITEYLCDTYDKEGRMIPLTQPERTKVQQWIHAAEGTFLLHALAITYARWFSPPRAMENGDSEKLEQGLSVNVHKDLGWLEAELSKTGDFLVSHNVTAADIMVHFSIQFIFARELGLKGVDKGKRKNVNAWMGKCEESQGYKRAVEKIGYTLFPAKM